VFPRGITFFLLLSYFSEAGRDKEEHRELKSWMKWGAALVVTSLMAAAGIYLAYTWWLAEPVLAVAPELEIARVQRGPMTVTVRAVGAVAAPSEVTLNFGIGGRLTELMVEEGEVVQAGNVLARLDTMDLELLVDRAEAALDLTRAQLARTKVGATEAELSSAEASLAAAQANYEEVRAGPLAAELASAEAALKSAETSYRQLLVGPTGDERTVARANLEKTEITLQAAQAEYDEFAWQQGFEASPQAATLHQATIDYQQALARYNLVLAGPTSDQLDRAQAQIAQARAQLERVLAGRTGAALESAAAQVARAQAEIDGLRNSPTPEELSIAQAQVLQAQIGLEQARRQLDYATLTAPSPGTVMAIGANMGQSVSAATPVIVLADLSHPELKVGVNEMDIGQIQLGQSATILLEAFPSHELKGRVSKIAPLPTAMAGVVNYPVTIELNEHDVAARPGMAAQAEITVSERADVLLVPRAGLRPRGGEWVVWVQRGGRVVGVKVEIGHIQGRAVEVLGNLAEGEEVVIGTAASSTGQGYGLLPRGLFRSAGTMRRAD
jgi:HlyD family secretion protein